jgi:hypothetical protein
MCVGSGKEKVKGERQKVKGLKVSQPLTFDLFALIPYISSPE